MRGSTAKQKVLVPIMILHFVFRLKIVPFQDHSKLMGVHVGVSRSPKDIYNEVSVFVTSHDFFAVCQSWPDFLREQ